MYEDVDFSECTTAQEVISLCIDANPGDVDEMIEDAILQIRTLWGLE